MSEPATRGPPRAGRAPTKLSPVALLCFLRFPELFLFGRTVRGLSLCLDGPTAARHLCPSRQPRAQWPSPPAEFPVGSSQSPRFALSTAPECAHTPRSLGRPPRERQLPAQASCPSDPGTGHRQCPIGLGRERSQPPARGPAQHGREEDTCRPVSSATVTQHVACPSAEKGEGARIRSRLWG